MPYVEAGEGELLLFVHGSLCDYRYWQPQLDWHGRSSIAASP